jgi:hypothetical protein
MRALEAARERPGNGHDTLLQILELQGVVAAMLQNPAKAREAFQALLVLDPDHRLKGDYAPRVVTPFFEAKAWVSDNGVLKLVAAPASKHEATVDRLGVRVPTDPLNLGRTVRFHLRVDETPWSQPESPLVKGEASVPVKGGRVQWWAELLDEHQAVLATVGAAAVPLEELAPRLQARASLGANELEKPSGPPWRPLAYACLGVAVGAGATGGYFGLRSRSARSEVQNAPVDAQGFTTGMTQREAYALDERARSSARIANMLFGAAGVAAALGGTFWLLDSRVSVSATPTGVTVGGNLP